MTSVASLEFSKYVGVPYRDKGRDPVGWDCYGCFRFVFAERHKVLLPSYADTYDSATDKATVRATVRARLGGGEWAPVPLGDEREGDGIVFLLWGQPLHCGYVIAPGIMLHALPGRQTCIERYTAPLWNQRIEGIYRYG
jgi:probable lipoprotein NlpC